VTKAAVKSRVISLNLTHSSAVRSTWRWSTAPFACFLQVAHTVTTITATYLCQKHAHANENLYSPHNSDSSSDKMNMKLYNKNTVLCSACRTFSLGHILTRTFPRPDNFPLHPGHSPAIEAKIWKLTLTHTTLFAFWKGSTIIRKETVVCVIK